MNDILAGIAVLALYIILQFVVFPKLGVPT